MSATTSERGRSVATPASRRRGGAPAARFGLDSRGHWRYRPATRPRRITRRFRLPVRRVRGHPPAWGPIEQGRSPTPRSCPGVGRRSRRRGGEGMPLTPSSPVASGWSRLTGVILPITIVGAILVFIVPVPPLVLDLLLVGQHHAGGDRAADHAGDPHAAGVQRLPDDPAGDHADPAGAQRGDDAADPDARRRSTGSTRPAA